MNDKSRHCDPFSRAAVLLLGFVLLATAGLWFILRERTELLRLSAKWSGDLIHVYSAKDGPWYVTHLVAYKTNGYWRAVTQLPQPVTIIDSGGYRFTQDQIKSFTWVDIAGGIQPPPAVGEKVGVMYTIPSEGKRPPKKAPQEFRQP